MLKVKEDTLTRQTMCYEIPLEGGKYMAQLLVPRDLTQLECDKLCAVLRAVVVTAGHDELPSLPKGAGESNDGM